MKKPPLSIILLFICISCGYSTRMTGTWRAYPEKSLEFNKIAVLGLTKSLEARKLIEDNIEQKLLSHGINAESGLLIFPPNATRENTEPEVAKKLLTLNGFDAVITVSVLGIEDTRHYVPGSYLYTPVNTTSFYDYYGQMFNYMYSPGYYSGSVNVFLETNLYTYPEGKLVWSGQSTTTDISDLKRSADIFSTVLVKELVKTKVIVP